MNHVSPGSVRPISGNIDPVAGARDLGPGIAAAADEIERTQVIPEPLLTRIHDARLARMLLPRSAGGDQLDPWTYLHAIEEISRHDASVGWNLFVANSAALIAPFIPLETAQAIFSDARAWISWGPPNQIKALAVPGGYRVTGEWHFASGSRQATWLGAHCQVTEPDGSLRLNRFGRPTTRTLLFRKEYTQPIEDWNTIGMRGTASEGYHVHRPVSSPKLTAARERTPRCAAIPVRYMRSHCRGCMRSAWRRGLWRRPRECLTTHRAGHREDPARSSTPRRQSGRAAEVARREATLGSARAWLVQILKDVWATADDIAPIDLMPGFAFASAAPTRSPPRSRSPTMSTKPPAHRRFFAAPRSSAASATSTRCRSRSSRAIRISSRWVGPCSTGIRMGYSFRRSI